MRMAATSAVTDRPSLRLQSGRPSWCCKCRDCPFAHRGEDPIDAVNLAACSTELGCPVRGLRSAHALPSVPPSRNVRRILASDTDASKIAVVIAASSACSCSSSVSEGSPSVCGLAHAGTRSSNTAGAPRSTSGAPGN